MPSDNKFMYKILLLLTYSRSIRLLSIGSDNESPGKMKPSRWRLLLKELFKNNLRYGA